MPTLIYQRIQWKQHGIHDYRLTVSYSNARSYSVTSYLTICNDEVVAPLHYGCKACTFNEKYDTSMLNYINSLTIDNLYNDAIRNVFDPTGITEFDEENHYPSQLRWGFFDTIEGISAYNFQPITCDESGEVVSPPND